MKPVFKRRPDRRLAKLIRLPGGRTIEDIEADVEARLEALHDVCLAGVHERLQEILTLAAAMPRPPRPEDLQRLYDLSNAVIGQSGVAGLEDLGRAALSFCQLLDAWRSGRRWSAASFDVHLNALKLMSQADGALDAAGRAAVLEGLNRVARRAAG